MPDPRSYTWNAGAARFKDSAGRFVPRRQVTDALDAALESARKRGVALSQQLRAGNVNLRDWETGMRTVLKDVHLYSAAAARGGWAQMSYTDFGNVGPAVRFQYGKLHNFAQQIEAGYPLDGRFMQRVELYVLSGRSSYHRQDEAVQRERGMTQERNQLHAGDHCDGCVGESARGWVPIGALVAPGQRQCLSRCKCTVEFRGKTPRAPLRGAGDEEEAVPALPASAKGTGPPAMTKTAAQVNDDLERLFYKESKDFPTMESWLDAIADAVDAQATGYDVQVQRSVGRRWLLGTTNEGYLGLADWDGSISLSKETVDALRVLRQRAYAPRAQLHRILYEEPESRLALNTVLHELEHMRSPTRYTGVWADAHSYSTREAHRVIEEGLVERRARQRIAHLARQDIKVPRIYDDEVSFMDWYAGNWGEASLETVWQGANGTARVAEMAGRIRPWLREQAGDLAAKVDSLTDAELVEKASYLWGEPVASWGL